MPLNINDASDYHVLTEDDVLGNGNTGAATGTATATPVLPLPPTTVVMGQATVTTAGTRVALGAATNLLAGIDICALPTNTGNIFVGDNTVTSSNGRILVPGQSVFVAIKDRNTINIDSAVNGEGVSYIGS